MSLLEEVKKRHHDYESGVDRGVFYPQSGAAVPWNGLTSITEEPKEADNKPAYVDGVKVRNRNKLGEFAGTIRAFTYPDEFYEALTQRRPKPFGLSYRVMSGSSYKLHLVYNVQISPGGISREQRGTEPFSWDFTTKPVGIPDGMMGSHLIVDSDKAYPWTVEAIEGVLYGSESESPRLLTPQEVFEIFEENSFLRVVDNGDGTFSITGPDEVVLMLTTDEWEVTWPSAEYIDADSYTVQSL
jgi:hypothetical protein